MNETSVRLVPASLTCHYCAVIAHSDLGTYVTSESASCEELVLQV